MRWSTENKDEEVSMELRHQAVGPWSVNTYVLICPTTGDSVLCDPGADPDTLEKLLEGSRPTAILITHAHPDHVGALKQMRDRLKVPVMAHAGNGSRVEADHWLGDGANLQVGRCRLRVFHTPGHTPDQICYAIEGSCHTLVGDTIFEGGPGRTGSPDDFQTTLATLRNVVLTWPDDTICHPGHGTFFRLGDQREAIERFIGKDHGHFFGDATWGQ
jgi:glyoxylase-like metal-dependent hydrolase (beta-lactamase superfamily II)